MDVAANVRRIIAEYLEEDESKVTENSHFSHDLNLDSLGLAELVMELEQKFDISIPDNELESIQTVGEAIKLIEQRLAAK